MTARIIFLLALLILPSVLYSQNNKPSFSVELKIDKLNYSFGEEIKPIVVIKNISGKKDSLSPNDLEDVMTANNLQIFRNSKPIGCQHIYSYFVGNQNKVFEPDEVLEKELPLSSFCGEESLGRFSSYNILDTGFYNCITYLGKTIYEKNKDAVYKKTNSNEIFFKVHPPDSIELQKFEELKKILDYSQQQLKDTVYMISVLEKLDSFTRQNINSNFSDIAFRISTFQAWNFNKYKDEEEKLADFYLANRPDGFHISNALYVIYNNEFARTGNKEKAVERLREYMLRYPNTKIEIEAKIIMKRKVEQEKKKSEVKKSR